MPSVSPCRSSLFVQLRSRLWPQQGSCRQVVRWSQPFAGCSATPKQENEKQQRPDGRADGNDKIRFNASTLRRRFIKLSNFQTSNFRTFALSKHGRTAMYALHVHNLYTAAYNFLHHIPLQKHHHDHHQACITKGYDHTHALRGTNKSPQVTLLARQRAVWLHVCRCYFTADDTSKPTMQVQYAVQKMQWHDSARYFRTVQRREQLDLHAMMYVCI